MRKLTLLIISLFLSIGAMAQFEEGVKYRIKDVATGKYLNAGNYDEHTFGKYGGVNVVDYNKSSAKMVFTAEASGDGYKLKTLTGKYITCQSWNVDALSGAGTAVKFVNAGDGQYYIMNGANYFKVENVDGTYYPFCDASSGAAAKWVIETVSLPDGIYTIQADENGKRGYLAANSSYDRPVLTEISWSDYAGNSATAMENGKYWYLATVNGKTYMYNIAKGQFVTDNGTDNIFFSGTPFGLNLTEYASSEIMYIHAGSGTGVRYLSMGCGTTAPGQVKWEKGNASDGGCLLTFTPVENGTVTYKEQIAEAREQIDGLIVKDVDRLSNNKVYTLVSKRGWLIYNSDNPDKLASTKAYPSFTTGRYVEACQWAIYKSQYNRYYLYNIGAGKFVGKNSNEAGLFPLVTEVTNHIQVVPSTTGDDYAFVFSTDNYGAINHINRVEAPGVANWRGNDTAGGLRALSDDGSVHKVTEVYGISISEDVLAAIEAAVAQYEDNSAAKAALAEKIQAVRELPIGTGVGKYTSSIEGYEEEFEQIVAYSNAITGDILPAEIEVKTARVEEIMNSFSLNMPAPGSYIRIKSVATEAYLSSVNHATQTTRAAYVAGADVTTIFKFDGTSLYSYASRQYLVNNSNFLGYGSTESGATIEFQVANASLNLKGAYSIKLFGTTRWLYAHANNYTDAGSGNNGKNYSFYLEEVTELPVAHINNVGYATLEAAAAAAQAGQTVVLLKDTEETLVLPAGVKLDKSNVTAPNVNEAAAKIGDTLYATLAEAANVATKGETVTILRSTDETAVFAYGVVIEKAEGVDAPNATNEVAVYVPANVVGDIVNNSGVETETVNGVVGALQNNEAVIRNTPTNLPVGAKLVVTLVNIIFESEAPAKVVYDVTPKNGDAEVEPTEEITFRLPVPANWKYAKVYHETALEGIYPVQEGNYVEVASKDFSEFAVEIAEPVAKIGDVDYYTFEAAVDAAQAGDEVVVVADVADVVVDIDKNLTISGSATLNNVGLNANGADALTVKGLDFTGNSWINSGTAEALTVSGITANVAPVNTSYTNSRSAFISLGKVEAQQLALTVEDSKITVTSQGPDAILGWAAITEATIKNNVLKGSSDGYFNNADAVKFMAIADGAKFDIRGNEIYSNYNGIVFAQNTTRDNAYSVEAAGNKFVGGADHIWIEVTGGDVTHATFNAASDNTVNGNAITANDIKYHSAVIKSWSSYAGVDVVTDADGKVIGGTLASFSNEESLADGFVFNDNGDGTYGVQFASYIVLPDDVNSSNYAAKFGDNTVTDGTNYYATLQAAVEAVAGQANAVLYCKPGADVGSLQHAPVTSTLTVYGNGADVTGDTERDFDLGNTDPSFGNDITADMTLTVKHLNGCGAWGTKATEHTVNLVFENCANMGKVFINGTTGTLNITMTNCAFEGVINEAVYSNADGAITLTNVAFSNLNKAVNLNHKAAGTQTVTIDGCTFTNCGADVAADQIPVRVLSSVEGGKSVLAVTGSTFTGTPEGGADILLDYGVGLTTASVSGTAANVVVEKENNVGTTTAVKADETVEFTTALPVAQVGETKYMTLAEAFANAQADDIVTLVNNVALENPVVISGKALTLDLGAYTIEDKSTAVLTKDDDVWALIDLENGANLTVRGTGTIKANYAEVQGGWTGMAYCINVDNTSKLTVDGGNFINGNGGVQTLGEVVVNGGTFVSHNGGTCILATYTDAKVTVNGGTFKDSVEESDLYTGSGAVWAGFGAKIEIKGGTFDFAADPENGNVVWTLFPAQNAIAGYGVNAEMAVSGGTFVNFNPAENVIVDYSPSTGFTFGSVVAEGYAALQNLDGNYVVGVEPTATVNNLGMTTVKAGDYSIWNGSFDQNTEDDGDMPLSFVMQFLADQDAEDMETSPFADWYGDFVITFTGIENGSFTADGCYLAGHYGSFGWVKVPVDGMTIEEDARYPVMLGVGMGQKYNYICSSVEDFKCALYLTPEILEANPNIQVKLELAVVDNSKGSDAAASALVNNDKVYSVTEYTYNADDFEKVELPEVVITDIKGSLTDSDPDLTFALNFAIKDVESLDPEYLEKLFAQYGDWYTDYVLTISGLTDENVTFNADGNADGYLSGQYDAYSENWVSVPFKDVTLANNESLYIMEYAAKLMGQSGLRFTLAEVAEIVQNFDCGVYFTPEFLAANPGLKVDLQLKVFTEDAEGNKVNDINVATNNFDIEDYVAIVHAAGKQTQYCTTFANAVAAAADGATITMLSDVELTEAVKVVGKAITLDLNGKTVSGVCNSSQGHLVYIENGAGLTVKDGAVDGGGKLTYAKGTSNVGWTVDVKGAFTLEAGTVELTGDDWSIGYAVDVRPNSWGTEYTNPSVFTMNGGKLVSSDGAVRVASSSADQYANVSASFVMNGGEIDAAWDGVFIQQSNDAYDVLNFTINDGTIKGGLNPVRVYGPAPTSYVNGQECMSINFNGGTMTYTGTETREWVIDGVLRVGGGSSIETIVENGNITASEAFAQAQALPDGYKWEQDGETYKVVEAPKDPEVVDGKIEFIDGEFDTFVNAENVANVDITYKRTLRTSWVALYVPFKIPMSMLAENFEVAYFNDVHSYDDDHNGTIDRMSMELVDITNSNATLRANYPYFIRAKSAENTALDITLEDATLYADDENSIDCTSMYHKFEITGTHKRMTRDELGDRRVINTQGEWVYQSSTGTLKPFRFYLTITNRDGSPVVVSQNAQMSVVVRGEDGYTGVEGVENENGEDMIFDLQGRRVLEPEKGGLYIINGKKVLVK